MHGEEQGFEGTYLIYYSVHTCKCEVYVTFPVMYRSGSVYVCSTGPRKSRYVEQDP